MNDPHSFEIELFFYDTYSRRMDTELLIEVHQYYINSLKKQLSEERKPLVQSVQGKCVSVYISQTSCIHGNIKFYDSSDTEISVTEC
jgi:hypothetical protein